MKIPFKINDFPISNTLYVFICYIYYIYAYIYNIHCDIHKQCTREQRISQIYQSAKMMHTREIINGFWAYYKRFTRLENANEWTKMSHMDWQLCKLQCICVVFWYACAVWDCISATKNSNFEYCVDSRAKWCKLIGAHVYVSLCAWIALPTTKIGKHFTFSYPIFNLSCYLMFENFSFFAHPNGYHEIYLEAVR